MYSRRRYIVETIKNYSSIKKYLSFLCILAIFIGLTSFIFFGFYINNGAIKFIAKHKDQKNLEIEKVMTNPTIKFEYSKNNYYNMTAKEAIHKNDNDIELFDVIADGSEVNIKAGKLLVTNEGNDLIFSDNPVLIIKKTPKTIR